LLDSQFNLKVFSSIFWTFFKTRKFELFWLRQRAGGQWTWKQGCQIVYFQTKNPNLGNFLRALDCKLYICMCVHMKYFLSIWNILYPFRIFYDHLVHFVFIWYIFPVYYHVCMYREKSGNPAWKTQMSTSSTTPLSNVKGHS
jgi:hypothetical protein